ncbi:hypothetical protein AgCh_033974 [Apium graveolens]
MGQLKIKLRQRDEELKSKSSIMSNSSTECMDDIPLSTRSRKLKRQGKQGHFEDKASMKTGMGIVFTNVFVAGTLYRIPSLRRLRRGMSVKSLKASRGVLVVELWSHLALCTQEFGITCPAICVYGSWVNLYDCCLKAGTFLPVQRTPFKLKTSLEFCPYNGTGCCDLHQDLQLEKRFQQMNISNPRCASLVKSVLCARCNQFSAQLFRIESEARNVPVLCYFTETGDLDDFCTDIWNNCGDIPILNSPFIKLQRKDHFSFNTSLTKLENEWKSRGYFCEAFGSSSADEYTCFDGKNAIYGIARAPQSIKGLCLEKVGHGSYINMIPHPDNSNRVFVSNLKGKIWLSTIPQVGSKEILKMDELKPFLDLTNQVLLDPESGLMGITFHPNFEQNGRFFVSYICDKLRHEGCQGRCSCNTDIYCDPSKILPNNGIKPCQYHYVVAEFTANGSASKPYLAKTAYAVEVRRIFTMGLQYTGGHAGQILFGPADGYLYLMTGDGSQGVHSSNLAQNKRSLLGKILRVDIDNMPSDDEVEKLSLYGNYTIPTDNPYKSDNELAPEVWALGFKNPWRCSFDTERPSYFMCGDAGQDNYEEVDIVTKGGNYGWSIYEGPYVSHPANSSSSASTFIFPVSGYNHSAEDRNSGSASIIGGYFYRSMTDPCMYGRLDTFI